MCVFSGKMVPPMSFKVVFKLQVLIQQHGGKRFQHTDVEIFLPLCFNKNTPTNRVLLLQDGDLNKFNTTLKLILFVFL